MLRISETHFVVSCCCLQSDPYWRVCLLTKPTNFFRGYLQHSEICLYAPIYRVCVLNSRVWLSRGGSPCCEVITLGGVCLGVTGHFRNVRRVGLCSGVLCVCQALFGNSLITEYILAVYGVSPLFSCGILDTL